MKVFYMNDEQAAVTVRVLDSTYDPNNDSHNYYRLEPAQGKVFEVAIPKDTTLYIKNGKV